MDGWWQHGFLSIFVFHNLAAFGFSFGGADGDDGRLKLTPRAASQGEAKDDSSIDLTDLLCGPFLSMDDEDCDELQYGSSFGIPHNSNCSIAHEFMG